MSCLSVVPPCRRALPLLPMEPLKLIALDEEDLAVVSSLLQDAVLRVADMTYVPAQKRFAAVLNRFEWEKAVKEGERTRTIRRRRVGAQIRPGVRRAAQEHEAARGRAGAVAAGGQLRAEGAAVRPRDALLSRATPRSSFKSSASRPSSGISVPNGARARSPNIRATSRALAARPARASPRPRSPWPGGLTALIPNSRTASRRCLRRNASRRPTSTTGSLPSSRGCAPRAMPRSPS